MTYAKEGTLLRLVLDIYDYKNEVNRAFEQYLYQRERRAGEFPLKFQ